MDVRAEAAHSAAACRLCIPTTGWVQMYGANCKCAAPMCCSQYGYCGPSKYSNDTYEDYCSAGCDPAYGLCAVAGACAAAAALRKRHRTEPVACVQRLRRLRWFPAQASRWRPPRVCPATAAAAASSRVSRALHGSCPALICSLTCSAAAAAAGLSVQASLWARPLLAVHCYIDGPHHSAELCAAPAPAPAAVVVRPALTPRPLVPVASAPPPPPPTPPPPAPKTAYTFWVPTYHVVQAASTFNDDTAQVSRLPA